MSARPSLRERWAATQADVRRAAVPLFAAHVGTTLLAWMVAERLFAATPQAFAVGQAPFDAGDLRLAAQTAARLVRQAIHTLPLLVGLLGLWALLGPLGRAVCLRAMAGEPEALALRVALGRQPLHWCVELLHLASQALWGWGALAGLSSLPATTRAGGQAPFVIAGAAIVLTWALGALLLSTGSDLSQARLASDRGLGAALREGFTCAALPRAAAFKLALQLLAWGSLAGTLALSALAWPDRSASAMVIGQQLLALWALWLRGTWLATARQLGQRANVSRGEQAHGLSRRRG